MINILDSVIIKLTDLIIMEIIHLVQLIFIDLLISIF